MATEESSSNAAATPKQQEETEGTAQSGGPVIPPKQPEAAPSDKVNEERNAHETEDTQVQQEVRAAFDGWTAAWNDGNVDEYLTGYWDSPSTRYVSGRKITLGIDKIRHMYQKVAKHYQEEYGGMGSLTLTHFEVEPAGLNNAIVFGQFQLTLSSQQEPSTGCFTIHVRRIDRDPEGGNSWKIVSEHAST